MKKEPKPVFYSVDLIGSAKGRIVVRILRKG